MAVRIALIYLAIISFIAFAVTVWDKRCAKRDKWRVPEKTLILISLFGGSAAMYLTMKWIRHKTKHAKFMVGIPAIFVLQVAATVWVVWYLNK